MNKINKDSGTHLIQLFFIILLILFAVIASAVSNSISKTEAKKIHDRFNSGYEDALALYEDGSYWNAIQRLKDVKTEAKLDEDDYHKYYCLTKLCNAKMDLKSRRYRSAYDELSGCHDTMPTELMDDYLAL